MTVIHRYISRSFLNYFAIVLFMVVVIYLSIDFFSRIDKLIRSDLAPGDIVLYFAYKIPLIVSQITPVGVLLAVLIVFGLMNRNNEIIALKSSGISPFYLLLPVLAIGIIASFALFVFSEVVVPISIKASNQIEERESDRQMVASREKNIWVKHQDGLTHVKFFDPADQTLYGVSIYILDERFYLSRRYDARQAEYAGGQWVLYNAMIQTFKQPDEEIRIDYKDKVTAPMELLPSDFRQVIRESEEMSFTGLWRYIRSLESDGYDATEYQVDFHGKMAFPFVCLIMSLMGSAIALRGRTREGMAVSFGYGIVTAFLYWSLYSFCLSLGYGGLMPPWLAAWTANILFGFATGLMLVSLE